MTDYLNSQRRAAIDEVLHSEREREIATRRLIDGLSIERLAEEFDRSPRQMQRIVNKIQTKVFLHLSLENDR